jgi:hypothetical protein
MFISVTQLGHGCRDSTSNIFGRYDCNTMICYKKNTYFVFLASVVNMLRHLHGGHAKLIHPTTPKGYGNDYIHAETMYNITTMTHRKAKFGTLVFGGIIVGIAIPLTACSFQQKKARGGS